MSQIGTLTGGAGVVTVLNGLSHADEFIMLGTVDTANPLTGFQVEINGTTYINVVNQASLLSAYTKWMMKRVGASGATLPGIVFKVATGNIPQPTTYRFTNSGATTPIIYAWSDNNAGIPFLVGSKQVNASSYEDFEKFSALFIGTPANLSSAEVVYTSGRKETLSAVELGAMFAFRQTTEANGYLDGCAVIDNTDQSIKSVRLNCSAANTILIAKIPDASFKVLQGK